jgi:hypothetical protein
VYWSKKVSFKPKASGGAAARSRFDLDVVGGSVQQLNIRLPGRY